MSIKSHSSTLPSRYIGTKVGKELRRIIDREIDSYAQRYKTTITKAMKIVGRQAVMEWYSGSGFSTGTEVAAALRTEGQFIRSVGGKKTIRVVSHFDESAIDVMSEYYESARRWSEKHSELCHYSPGAYVFLLRWNYGYLALPDKAHATDSGWVNDNCETSPLGSLENFYGSMMRLMVMDTARGLMRGRNQKMGAGVASSNRNGLGNLSHG